MRNPLHLALVLAVVCGSGGPSLAGSVFAPPEVDVSVLPVNPLQPPTHLEGATGLLIAQSSYELSPGQYAAQTGANLAPHAMGAYQVPVGEAKPFGLATQPAATALSPDVLALNAELGHMLLSTPADMGLSTRSMLQMPLGFKQFESMSAEDFHLRNYRDGMREVYEHLR